MLCSRSQHIFKIRRLKWSKENTDLSEEGFRSDQIKSVAQSCPTLCNPMNRSMPGLPVHHQLLEFTETHIHRVSDAIQPSHPLSSPSPPAPSPSQHQSLFQWVNSSHEVAKVLEFHSALASFLPKKSQGEEGLNMCKWLNLCSFLCSKGYKVGIIG